MKTEFDAKLEVNKEEVRKHAQAGDEKVNESPLHRRRKYFYLVESIKITL
jgi:hypothetical protein